MRPWRRAAAVALAGLVVLLLSAAGAFAFLFYRPLPTTDGDQRLVGLEERAEVVRDAGGVPHLFARTARDVFFLQGYVLAQDRLFQLDLLRRTARGELSALLGDSAVEADRFTRTLGLARAAAADEALLSPDARTALDAFAEGVNKYLDQRGDVLPAELVLLGARPALWSPLDSLAILKLASLDLGPDLAGALARASVAARAGPDRFALLYPGAPSAARDDPGWAAARDAFADGIRLAGPAALAAVGGARASGLGGSCVALAGRRTASGAPLLASDPHLPLRDPAGWYAVGLHGGGYEVVGLAIPGVPGIAVGYTDRIAWGFTLGDGGVADLVVERPDPADPARVRTADGAEAPAVRHEEIAVRGGAPVPLDIVTTRHGPLLAGALASGSAGLALDWAALGGGRSLDGLLGLDRATDLAGYRAAAAQLSGVSLAACYADRDGHIAALEIGRAADRPAEDGRLPVAGWTAAADRRGGPPPSVRVRADPADGLVVAVADRPPGDATGPGPRAALLLAKVADLRDATLETARALQTDATSPVVGTFRAALLAALPRTPGGRTAQALVRGWDGTLATGSAAAAVYEAWVVHFADRSFRPVLGDERAPEYLASGPAERALLALLQRSDDPWAGPLAGPEARGRDVVAGVALDDAATELASRLGPDPAAWRWGALHRLSLAHPLAARLGVLRGLFEPGPVERPGDGWSPSGGGYDLARPYAVRDHATARLVVDLADPDEAGLVLPGGESGQPLSAHFGDQAARWLRGELVPLRFHRERVAGDTLVLRPR